MHRSAQHGLAVVAAALSAGLLLGCSAHGPVGSTSAPVASASQSPAPAASPAVGSAAGRARIASRHEVGGGEEMKEQAAREELESAYAAGQASLLEGDEDAAYDSFDRAMDAVLESGLDLDTHPALRERAEEVMDSIHDLAADAEAEETAGEEAPGVPVLDGEEEADRVTAARLAAADLTIPMVSHPSVDAMIHFYTGRAKERFEIGLQRYGKYAPTVQRIFEEEGVPGELAWLALVESNYNPQAYSRARARGLWQFISATGHRYGLKQDFWIDERSDFEKATRSAARYLKDLNEQFGDWHLALAAYNAGEGKIGRAIKSTGRRDFWQIRETRYIRRETKDYVPAFLAVVTIVKDPARYGITFAPSKALDWETCRINGCTDLGVIASCAGTTTECLAELNPELRRGATPGGDYQLRLPKGSRAQFEEKYAALPPEHRLTWHHHVVRRGETLESIARSYGSSLAAVAAANKLETTAHVATGTDLVVPTGSGLELVPASVIASRAPLMHDEESSSGGSSSSGGRRISYRVRPGDTLGKIASRHGVSVSKLADWNGLRNSNRIHVGQRLVLYSRGASTATASASGGTRSRTTHVVRSGDTLGAIASRYGVSVSSLRAMNGLGQRSVIRPGQRLVVSGGSSRASSSASASTKSASTKSAATRAASRTHTVRKGETLSAIARLYRTSVDDLRSWNGLRGAVIHPGDRLTIRN
jgi:membrane-bound lytic murein transglycosylase D